MNTNINETIFRQYDIRGIVGTELSPDTANLVGKAYGTYLLKKGLCGKAVTLGFDARLSSKSIEDAVSSGITSTGIDVILLGLCTTPMLYFSTHTMDVDGGIMITGSHNPPEYNGIKICIGQETIYGDEIQKLKNIVLSGSFKKAGKRGITEHCSIAEKYNSYLFLQFNHLLRLNEKRKNPLKVVIDAGNGTAGLIIPDLLKKLGCDVIPLFCSPDGNFPNHHPDPTIPENLKCLIKTLKDNNADIGFAYDGDADRLGVISDKGEIVWGDKILYILAKSLLKSVPNAAIVSEVKCSQVMYDKIAELGGRAIMWKAGHSLIKSKMREEKALLAGEMSGHIFYAHNYFGFDDAIYASLRFIEVLLKEGKTVSELLSDFPKTVSTPEIRVDCSEDKKFKIVEELKKILKTYNGSEVEIKELITIDGVRAVFENGWGLLRASNTQPALVMRFEADSEENINKYQEFVNKLLKKTLNCKK